MGNSPVQLKAQREFGLTDAPAETVYQRDIAWWRERRQIKAQNDAGAVNRLNKTALVTGASSVLGAGCGQAG